MKAFNETETGYEQLKGSPRVQREIEQFAKSQFQFCFARDLWKANQKHFPPNGDFDIILEP